MASDHIAMLELLVPHYFYQRMQKTYTAHYVKTLLQPLFYPGRIKIIINHNYVLLLMVMRSFFRMKQNASFNKVAFKLSETMKLNRLINRLEAVLSVIFYPHYITCNLNSVKMTAPFAQL